MRLKPKPKFGTHTREDQAIAAKKRKPGRPAFEPTEEQRYVVLELAGFGLTQDQICRLVFNPSTGKPIEREALARHFDEELKDGAACLNANVARSLYRNAVIEGNVTAQIFWTKARMGWRETSVQEQTGPNGQPLQPQQVVVILPANNRDKPYVKPPRTIEHAPADRMKNGREG